MKNIKTLFSKGFKAAIMVAVFGLVLGVSSIPVAKVDAQMVPVSGSIIATPDTIDRGGSTQLKWNSYDATSVSITPGIGNVASSGVVTVSPTETTVYTLRLSNNTGASGEGTATVFVRPGGSRPTVDLTADQTTVDFEGSTTLRWTTTGNPTSCVASGAWSGSKNTSGGNQSTGSLTSSRTFTITCSNSSGSDDDSVTVNVRNDTPLPTVDLRATPSSINSGDSTTISWDSNNTITCNTSGGANNWGGSVSLDGNTSSGNLFNTTTYYITCANAIGQTATDSQTVTVGGVTNLEGPDVTTRSATDIDRDEATLRGEVDGNGLSTRVWFEYSRDRDDVEDGDGEETDEQSTGSGSRSFDEEIDGLRENTRYYFRAVARNSEGTDYGSILSFTTDDDDDDNDRICLNTGAINYRGSLPCRYPTSPSGPSVVIYADSTNIAYGGTTFVRWNTVNATSCFASGGSVGWAGAKSIGPGSFYTGSLTNTRTYTITCSNTSGSATDSVTVNVRGRTVVTTPRPVNSLVIITSSIDRNQPILPTLDNTRPRVGDEINYTVTYQNIGTGSITNLVLRLDLPYEVDYMFSNPSNPSRSGNTLIFNLGTLRANGEGTVTVRVRVREDAAPGALLNFPATLSYTDPAGFPQSVSANVSAQVWTNPAIEVLDERTTVVPLGASIFGAGFWPTSLFGWLLFLILILVLVLLARSLFAGAGTPMPWTRKTITTVQH